MPVQTAAEVLRFNRIRGRVIELLDQGQYDDAHQFVEEAIAKLESEGPLPDDVRQEIKRLREDLEAYRRRPEYGSKRLHYRKYRSSRGKGEYRSS